MTWSGRHFSLGPPKFNNSSRGHLPQKLLEIEDWVYMTMRIISTADSRLPRLTMMITTPSPSEAPLPSQLLPHRSRNLDSLLQIPILTPEFLTIRGLLPIRPHRLHILHHPLLILRRCQLILRRAPRILEVLGLRYFTLSGARYTEIITE